MPMLRTLCRVCVVASSFLSVTSSQAAAQVALPAGLPAPWVARNIGAVASASATFSQGTFHLAGAAIIGVAADQFSFVYQAISGDVDVVVRVDAMAGASSKAGIMLRSALTADASHAFAAVSADRGATFERRIQTGGVTTATG